MIPGPKAYADIPADGAYERIPLPAGSAVRHPLARGEAVFADVKPSETGGRPLDPDRGVTIVTSVSGDFDFCAIRNHSNYWCRPEWGRGTENIPDKTSAVFIKKPDGGYIYAAALCGDICKAVLCGSPEGLVARVFSSVPGLTSCDTQPACVILEGGPDGPGPLALAKEAAEEISKLLHIPLRNERQLSPVFDRLGWCSWDAMHIFVNRDELLRKAAEFREKGVPVYYAILDDMWADCTLIDVFPRERECAPDMVPTQHRSMMRRFDGDPKRFPHGMEETVSALKEAGIPCVGIWFPTTGYWFGIDPDGELAAELDGLLTKSNDGRLIVKPEPEAAEKYFRLLCSKAASWGAGLVKIDNQGCHRFYAGKYPVGSSSAAMQQAIDKAALEYFDGALINCMGMPVECMLHRPSSAVCRCSDDFQPESAAWFSKNILQCSFNGLVQGQFYVNDWDMWWTDDGQAVKNSLCRAISGGPVYISDPLDRTVADVLRPLVLSDGRLLRCDGSATPADDCVMTDPTLGGLFKIRNTCGECGLVACFDLDREGRPSSGSVSPEDAGLGSGEYVFYEYFTRACGKLAPGERLTVGLASPSEIRLFTFIPSGGRTTVPLGRTDMYTGCAAVDLLSEDSVSLAEGGRTGFYSETEIEIFCLATDDGDPASPEAAIYTPGERRLPTAREGFLITVECPRETRRLSWRSTGQAGQQTK